MFYLISLTLQKSLVPDTYVAGFIGNLEIGRRYPDETIFRRVIEFNNPTNTVQSSTLTLTVSNGKEILSNKNIIDSVFDMKTLNTCA